MQLGLEEEQTVLFVQDGASRCISYHRPRKYPLTLEMHKRLRNNAYSCLPNKASLRDNIPAIEPWHDNETYLYDLPKPCNHMATSRQLFRPVNTHKATPTILTSSVAFPEDLNISFHCGQLDTSLNCSKIVNASCSNFEGNIMKNDPVSDISTHSEPQDTSNMVVPDCDDVSLDCGDIAETNTDSFYSLDDIKALQIEKTRAEFNSRNNTQRLIDTNAQDLPLLFYPRSKRKRAFKVTKQSKNPSY